MDNINIFEYAAEKKLRFNFKGSITVEDLYDLSVEELDSIYKKIKADIRKQNDNEDSLLTNTIKKDISLSVKAEIIEHIVNGKLVKKAANEKAAQNRERKQMLLAILAQKEQEGLRNKTPEELAKMIEELE